MQEAGNWQNYNRYSYVYNNPLIFTDPSGYRKKSLEEQKMDFLYQYDPVRGFEGFHSTFSGGRGARGGIAYNYASRQYEYGNGAVSTFQQSINQFWYNPSAVELTSYNFSLYKGFFDYLNILKYTDGTFFCLVGSFGGKVIGEKDFLFTVENGGSAAMIAGNSVVVCTADAEDYSWSKQLDDFQATMDAAGVVDPTPLCDGISGIISLFRGKWKNAAISAIAIIPYAGDLVKGGKYVAKTINVTSKARTAERGLELGERFLKSGYTEIAPGVFRSADDLRQFRMTTRDITGAHGNIGPHFNFEIFSPLNTQVPTINYHVPIINP